MFDSATRNLTKTCRWRHCPQTEANIVYLHLLILAVKRITSRGNVAAPQTFTHSRIMCLLTRKKKLWQIGSFTFAVVSIPEKPCLVLPCMRAIINFIAFVCFSLNLHKTNHNITLSMVLSAQVLFHSELHGLRLPPLKGKLGFELCFIPDALSLSLLSQW